MGKMNDFLLGVYWDALSNANDNMHDLEKQKSQVSFSPFQTEPSSNVGLEQTSDDAPMLSVISYFNAVGLAYMICCLAVWTFHIYCSVCIFPNKVILFNLSSSLPIPLGCVEWSLNTYSSQHLSCHCLLFPVACTILVLILESKEMACCYPVQSTVKAQSYGNCCEWCMNCCLYYSSGHDRIRFVGERREEYKVKDE